MRAASRRVFHQPVHQLDHQKDAERQDGEIHALLDEGAVVPVDWFGRLGRRLAASGQLGHRTERFRCDVAHAREVDTQVREVGIADQRADRRHEDVVHERRDDFAERPADDYADGHVHDIALERKFLEFLEKCHIRCF